MPPDPRSQRNSSVSHTGVFTRERIKTLSLLAVTAIAVYLCYRIVQPFLPALTWALALAVVARPVHHAIARRIHYPSMAAGVSTMLVTLLLLTPVVLLAWQIVSEISTFATVFEEQFTTERLESVLNQYPRAAAFVERIRENTDIEAELREVVTGFGGGFSAMLSNSVWVLVQILVTLLVLFFLFRDEPRALAGVREYLPLSSEEKDHILKRVDDTIYATIYGTVVVSVVQGTLAGLMFWWLGLPAPLLWGLVMAAMAVIPYLGAYVIWVPAAAYLALEGSWGKAIVLALWGSIVVGLIDNLLYPILVGKRLRQHTLVAFFAIVGGFIVFGASGIVLGPVIVTTTAALIDIWWRRTTAGHAADTPEADGA